jgi:hypothetical protein
MRATEGALRWTMTAAWCLALVGFIAAGAMLLGVRGLDGSWRRYAAGGLVGSVVLLMLGWPVPLAGIGLGIDVLIGVILLATRTRGGVIGGVGPASAPPRALDRAVVAALGALTILVAARPWAMRWGSTPAELGAALPGDDPALRVTYQIQHAVTIRAAPDRVWPWLVQLGEDRGGFYSYAVLERLVGLDVRNADRIHPEWQRLAVGDTVFATHVGWMRLRRRLGWRVAMVCPDTVLVLEKWGAFVLVPLGRDSTRLIVRTRGGGADELAAVALAPLGFLLFEPVHFVMQREMLLTLKARAEAEPALVRSSLRPSRPRSAPITLSGVGPFGNLPTDRR